MNAERLKFDPRTYTSFQDEEKLAVNLADIAIEARVGPVRERINPYRLIALPDGRVINPQLGEEDILSLYRRETAVDRQETEAATKIRDALLNDPPGTLAVWFSPPSPVYGYVEGRITVGFSRLQEGIKDMQSYGIPVVESTPHDMLGYAWRLSEFSDRDYLLSNPEDLRHSPIIFPLPEGENPWEFLAEYLPFPDVWEAIKTNDVEVLRGKALEASRVVASSTLKKILISKTFYEQVDAIEYAIGQLGSMGMEIDTDKLVCPVNGNTGYSFSHYSVAEDGKSANGGEAKLVIACGNCGVLICKYISKGYTCSTCSGVYAGC